MARRLPYRLYFMCLCGLYLVMVFVFHGRLQLDITKTQFTSRHKLNSHSLMNVVGKAASQSNPEQHGVRQLRHIKRAVNDKVVNATQQVALNDWRSSCLLNSDSKQFTYVPVKPKVFYVYSAYLDKRDEAPVVRVIALIVRGKKSKIDVKCLFRVGAKEFVMNATIYEMCENHNRRFGGYILSCSLPNIVRQPCQVAITYVDSELGEKFEKLTRKYITLNIMKIEPESAPFKFGVCIPPLFGDVKKSSIVEFIELTKLLGSQHFVFYDFNITSNGTKEVLDYYAKERTVTVIPWKLPSHIEERDIWYHGQLLAHNDCLYRSMSLMNVVAINDIDEYIIPHDNYPTWNSSLMPIMTNNVVGLSFNSAFYDPHAGKNHPSGLITIGNTGRSKLFSRIRTKVMLKPDKVFEVGIHHVSKPAKERYVIKKVENDIAYLHHYRKCVSNYGMRCTEFQQDDSVNKYYDKLKLNFDFIMNKFGHTDSELGSQ
ncbi:beta-1,4-galactosyltransferase galt-1-like [Mizuhopecten yessoensis]|uniref:beta-1,4-galactosyltransferase galt-1-like n=1 Tax=Mizuhopecten yessoensis TaxID=6573 RepID=UPI000B459AD2|nr:beta-1,4-galactosyltransferase galt-1-like [Mizuhopecten yessoensis]